MCVGFIIQILWNTSVTITFLFFRDLKILQLDYFK